MGTKPNKKTAKTLKQHLFLTSLFFLVFCSLNVSGTFADVIVDNGDSGTSYTGTWQTSGGTGPYGVDSLWARNGATYTWMFDSQPSGTYEVFMWWSEWPSRATDIDVTISYHLGYETISINQQESSGQWNSLGTYNFDSSGSVTITAADGSTVSTCADAVWFNLISENSLPVAYIDSIIPNPAEPAQPIEFTGHGEDTDGNITAYNWESSIDGNLSDANFFSTEFLSEGVHTISFEVQDDKGFWSVAANEVLIVGSVPIETTIDNRDPETSQTGTWQVSGGADPYGADSVWSRNGATFTWHFTPPQIGEYEVSMWWTEWSSRSTNAPVDIEHSGGTSRVYINQQQNGGQWNYLGTYVFEQTTGGSITVIAENAYPTSYCADAVKFSLIESNITPVAVIDSITPNPADLGEIVSFVGHGEDIDGSVEAYSWQSSIDGNLSDSNFFSTELLSEGEHVITFMVQDNEGKWSMPVTEDLFVGNISPVAYIDSITPNPATIGEAVTFTGHGEDIDGLVTGYSWESSIDGNLSDANSFFISSLSLGEHIITFRVYDDEGAVSEPVSQTLTVQEVVVETIIDNGGPGTSYTGTWSVSAGPNPYGTDSYWSRNGSTYTWTFSPTISGYYGMSMWWTEWPSRSANVPVDIEHIGGISRIYINQQQNGGQWNDIGQYLFESGTSYTVTITSQPGPSSTCADAVRFIYLTGGNMLPTAMIDSISPNPAQPGETITFVGHGTDSDGTVQACNWRSSIDGYLSDSNSFSISTLSTGSHTIFFGVQDDQETWSPEVSATLNIGVEDIYVAFIYNWERLEPRYTSMLQDIGAYLQGSVWTYVNYALNKTYRIHLVRDIETLKQALKTEGAHIILAGHSNYGLGPVFGTSAETSKQVIEDIRYVDDDRILNLSTPWIHVSVTGMRTGQAYPYWWPIFKDGTSGIMPYEFGDPRGDPAYNYYLTYQVPGDPNHYMIETVRNSAVERFSDSGRAAWYSLDGTGPDPNDPNHIKYYITNPAPWSPSFESFGDWVQYQINQDDTDYFKENYVYNLVGVGNDQAKWLFTIPEVGDYRVLAWWPASQSNASDAPYTVNHTFGSTTVRMNQRIDGRRWNEVGQFHFDANDYSVVLSDDADSGRVVADAVRISHADNPPEVVAADFTARTRSGPAPLDVEFTNTSTGDLTGRTWDFGDGHTNTTRDHIDHQYISPGTYTVSLEVSGPAGSDSKTKVGYITVGAVQPDDILQAEFSSWSPIGAVPLTVRFRDSSSGDLRKGITYTPEPGFTGTDTFTYTVSDDEGAVSNEATVTVTVYAGNVAPVANDNSATTRPDTPVTIDVISDDIDIDGTIEPSSVTVTNDPNNGVVVINGDGTVTYTPNPGFAGTDTFTYTVTDNEAATSNEATVTVYTGNLSPVAKDDSANTKQDTDATIDVIANDTDTDGAIDANTVVVTADTSNGVVVINGDGTVTYTPNTGFTGTDIFTYTVADNEAAISNEATVTVYTGNLSPVAKDDSADTDEDTPVTINVIANDTDTDGTIDANTVVVTADPNNGTAVVNPDGTVIYTPDTGFTGTDVFTYTVADDEGATSNEASVTINPVNLSPVANDDSANTREIAEVTVDVLANDNDSDGSIDPGTIVVTGSPSNGTIVVHNCWFWDFGDGQVSHEQNPRHTYPTVGNYTVSLTVTDADGHSITETKENFVRAVVFEKSIDNVDYPKTHYRNKTLLFRKELEIEKDELKYTRMLYDSCNSGNYYLGTFNRGIMFYTLANSGSRGSVLYLQAYLQGVPDEQIWEIVQNYEPSYDYYNFNELPPVLSEPMTQLMSQSVSMPSSPVAIDSTLDSSKEEKIRELAELSIEEAFERLQEIDFVTDEVLLHEAISATFKDSKAEAIALSLEYVRLPLIDVIDGRVVSRASDLYIAKNILQVFSDDSVDPLLELYESSDAVTKGNIVRAAGQLAGEQAIRNMLIESLNDKTFHEDKHPEAIGSPLRICDLAYNQLVLHCKIKDVLRTIGTTHSIEVRDYHINILKGKL